MRRTGLRDLDDAFRDPEVRAIVAFRGGAGAYRIAGSLGVAAVHRDPRPVVGFSDITHLHLALWRGCGLVGVHGACDGAQAPASARALLMEGEAVVPRRDRAPARLVLRRGTARVDR